MTRKKKARKIGSEGSAQYSDRSLSKEDVAALARKRESKSKGLKAGSRHSEVKVEKGRLALSKLDPRLGSKTLIPLVVEQKPHPKSVAGKKIRRLSAKQELENLENDPQLNVLLDRIENGDKLGAGLQSYVDERIDRIEILMKQLGLFEDEPAEETKPSKKSKNRTDEEMLAEFDNFKFDKE